MSVAYRLSVFVLCFATVAYTFDEGSSWDRVRYHDGALATRVSPKGWDNKLTVTSSLITFKLKDGQHIEIPAKSVTALSYGEEANRRIGTMAGPGALHKSLSVLRLTHKAHFIGIEYQTSDGKKSGLLLEGEKNNYAAMLTALESATGAPIYVSPKDREYVPGMLSGAVASGPGFDKNAPPVSPAPVAPTTPAPTGATQNTGAVSVKSTPDGADVFADGYFMGNTPSSLQLTPGKHSINVTKAGYKDWTREITVTAGSSVALNASLEKRP